MFLLVNQPADRNGKSTYPRYVNLKTINTFGPADGAWAEAGYNSVLFTANGYAMYSTKTPEEIISLAQLEVIQ